MTQRKQLAWNDICGNGELVVKLWNRFIKEDAEVAKEAEDYGEKYMKVYPNTYEGILEAYGGKPENFIKDNKSFWGGSGSDGYSFDESWFMIDITASEEEFATSDNSTMELIDLIIMNRFGDMTKTSVGIKRRFKQYCIEHHNELKKQED